MNGAPASNAELLALALQIDTALTIGAPAPASFFGWRWRDALRASAGAGHVPLATSGELRAMASFLDGMSDWRATVGLSVPAADRRYAAGLWVLADFAERGETS